jgi:Tfp pilus assembly protein FimT
MRFHNSYQHRQTAGYTLIELLAVIIFAGILAAIAAPTWFSFANRQRVGTVRDDLLQTLKQTQQDAIQQRREIAFSIVPDADLPTINSRGERVLGEGSGLQPGTVQLNSYYIDGGTAENPPVDLAIVFDYQGQPVNNMRETETGTTAITGQTLPFVISIKSTDSGQIEQCVIIANLIGSIKTAEGEECLAPDVEVSAE